MKNPENFNHDKKEPERLKKTLEINQPLSTIYYMKEELRQIWSQSGRSIMRKIY